MNIEEILAKYNIPECLTGLECDGSTSVISQVLQFHNIPHKKAGGMLVVNANREIVHFWITLPDGRYIDFKARMWAGPEAPEGIFDPAGYPGFYRLVQEHRPVKAYFLAEILAGI